MFNNFIELSNFLNFIIDIYSNFEYNLKFLNQSFLAKIFDVFILISHPIRYKEQFKSGVKNYLSIYLIFLIIILKLNRICQTM